MTTPAQIEAALIKNAKTTLVSLHHPLLDRFELTREQIQMAVADVATGYTPDQQRVAEWFCQFGIGGGDDPIGSLIASHESLAHERNQLRAAAAKVEKMDPCHDAEFGMNHNYIDNVYIDNVQEQINKAYRLGFAFAKERCAKVAEAMEPLGYEYIAAAIRALKDKP